MNTYCKRGLSLVLALAFCLSLFPPVSVFAEETGETTAPVETTAAPEPTEPEATKPQPTEPEPTEPEVTEPEVTEPEVTEPEATEPEAAQASTASSTASSEPSEEPADVTPSSDTDGDTSLVESGDHSLSVSEGNPKNYNVVNVGGNLELTLYDSFSVTGSFTVGGDLKVYGDSDKEVILTALSGIEVKGNIIIEDTTLALSGKTMTAMGDEIEFRNAHISNAEFVGFEDDSKSPAVLRLENSGGKDNRFTEVDTLGMRPSHKGIVTLAGNDTAAAMTIYDVAIIYHDMAGEAFTAESGWPTHYRRNESTILGYTVDGAFIQSETVPLPVYNVLGYKYQGWSLSQDGTTPITGLKVGEYNLYTVQSPKDVLVTYDLNYEPSEKTSDNYQNIQRINTFKTKVGELLDLQTPWQLGYQYDGVKALTAEDPNHLYNTKINLVPSVLDYVEETDSFALNLQVQWTPKEFVIYLTLPLVGIRVKDNETDWMSAREFADAHEHLEHREDSSSETFTLYVPYGSTLDQVAVDKGLKGLTLESVDPTKEFSGWVTSAGVPATSDNHFAWGELFGKPREGQTLAVFEQEFTTYPLNLQPVFENASCTFSFDPASQWSGSWTLRVNGKDAQFSDNQLALTAGDVLIWRCITDTDGSRPLNNFGLWTVKGQDSGEYYPAKEAVSGDKYYESGYSVYTLTVPAEDCTVTFTSQEEKVELNLAESPITEGSVTVSGRKRSGFWTDELLSTMSPLLDMSGNGGYGDPAGVTQGTGRNDGNAGIPLRYFYEWNEDLDLWITTKNVKTQNQYYVIRSGTVSDRLIYFRDCYLEAFAGYHALTEATIVTDQLASTFCNVYVEWIDGGQTTNLKIDGKNNIIGSVGSNKIGSRIFRMTGTTQESEIRLGCVFSFSQYNQSYGSLSFYPYASDDPADLRTDNYPYIAYDRIQGCSPYVNIYLPEKKVKGSLDTQGHTGFIHLKSASGIAIYNGLMVLEEDSFAGYGSLNIRQNASLIVKGEAKQSEFWHGVGSTINTTGVVAFLGNTVHFQNMQVQNGTIIANSIETNMYTRFTGGTVITNHIRNPYAPVERGSWISEKNAAVENGDDYPFKTYPYMASNHGAANSYYLFGGTTVYLMGYYDNSDPATRGKTETVVAGRYDWNTANPIADVAKTLIDLDPGDGKTYILNTSVSQDVLDQVYADSVAKYSSNETIMVGNSAALPGNISHREFRFEGGEIYSAGNMTLYNTAIVNGGTIVCGGAFTSKQDLTINGGSVTAAQVGNSAGQAHPVAGETRRYANVTINGGTVTTDRIGARADTAAYPVSHHGNLVIGGGAEIQLRTEGGSVQLVNDAYANYSYDAAQYTKPDTMPAYLRATGTYGSDVWASDAVDFDPPGFADPSETAATLKWSLSAAEMQHILGTTPDGKLDLENMDDLPLWDRDHVVFNVVNAKPYRLTVHQDGDYITNFSEPTQPAPGGSREYQLESGKLVTLNIPQDMTDKVILWYRDGNGAYHSIPYQISGTAMSFTMPFADCDLYVAKKMTLYLDQTPVGLTAAGFRLEEDSGQADSHFAYAGDLQITDSRGVCSSIPTIDAYKVYDASGASVTTLNRIIADSGFQQNGRKITLHHFVQPYDDNRPAIVIREGADITLSVQDSVGLGQIQNPLGSSLTIAGTGNRDTVRFSNDNYNYHSHIEASRGGNVTLENLTIFNRSSLISSETQTSGTATIRNCDVHSNSTLVLYYDTVIYEASALDITDSRERNVLGYTAVNMRLTGCTVSFHDTLDKELLPHTAVVTLEDSQLVHTHSHSDNCTNLQKAYCQNVVALTMVNSSYTAEQGMYTGKLVISENSRLELGKRLISPDIQVTSGAAISAPYVVTAGYGTIGAYDLSTRPNKDKLLVTHNGAKSSGILVDGGSIDAEFVGGDYNGKVTLKSGSIDAKYIGTYGAYFFNGLTDTGIYANQETYTWSDIDNPPVRNATVTISGGTVNLREDGLLGGGDSTVTIQGGTINAPDGDIQAKTIRISGDNLAVEAENILSDGSITIDGAKGTISNPYTTGKHPTVAVKVLDSLRARTLLIRNGSAVYAANAYSYAESGTSSFQIDEGTGTGVYVQSYGGLGAGTHDVQVQDRGDNQNIWGVKAVSVSYNLNVDPYDPDQPENDPDNPTFYSYDANKTILLLPPSRDNYEFIGWSDSMGQSDVKEISCGVVPEGNLYTLTANWKPVEVTFQVRMDVSQSAGFVADPDKEFENVDAEPKEDGRYYYDKTVSIPYGSVIINADGLSLSDYATYTRQIISLKWNGTDIVPGNTTVSAGMVDDFQEDDKIAYLDVSGVNKINHALTFDLNKAGGKPVDAAFTEDPTAFTLTRNAAMGDPFTKLPDVTATGYDFGGWRDETGNTFDTAKIVERTFPKNWYAIWEAKSYTVRFDAVTPEGSALRNGTYHITDTPDQPAGEGFRVENGTDTGTHPIKDISMAYDAPLTNLPTPWREGSVFQYWYYLDKDGNEIPVSEPEKLVLSKNTEVFGASDFWTSKDDSTPALTLYAKYRNIQVTYELRGGRWIGETNDVKEYDDSGLPLYAYGSMDNQGSADFAYVAPVGSLAAVSTSVSWYQNNGYSYYDGDYRRLFQNSGHTFAGWLDAEDKPIAVTPMYSDMEVHASWTPNTYTLRLHAADTSMDYKSGATFVTLNQDGSAGQDNTHGLKEVTLTVDQSINTATCSAWPARDAWGTLGADETVTPRNLWGFTYLPLDPQLSSDEVNYSKYFNLLAQMYTHSGMLLVRNESTGGGSSFQLPDVAQMKQLLADRGYDSRGLTIPEGDIPAGYTFDLYATYRDYALIFMQFYRDAAGNEVRKVLKTVRYGDVTNLDFEDPDVDKMTSYTHLGWYINQPNMNGTKYDSSWSHDYLIEQLNGTFKQQAKELGTFDVIAYSVYAAAEKMTMDLRADPDAHMAEEIHASRVWSAVVPMNMQAGTVSIQLDIPAGLHLVSKQALDNQLYQTGLGDGKTANNTAALVLTLNGQEIYLSEAADDTDILVEPGDSMRLTLYHSYVMTASGSWTLPIALTFKHYGTPIEGQSLKLTAGIYLEPSRYTVTLDANTSDYVIQENNSFQTGGVYSPTITRTNTLDKLLADVILPEVEGYTQLVDEQGWTVLGTNNKVTLVNGLPQFTGENLTPKSPVTLTASWKAKQHSFTVSQDVLKYWDVTCGEAAVTTPDALTLDYRTPITFRLKENADTQAAYVFLKSAAGDTRLDTIPQETGAYRLTMPDSDLTVRYQDVMELYLENDSIAIAEAGGTVSYTYLGETLTWPGSFRILMDESNNTDGTSTENVLTLSGSLSGVEITLGNLNVSSDNSIGLTEGSSAVLVNEGSLILRNLSVGKDAQVTVEGGSIETREQDTLYLGSWIGGEDAANVTLKDVAVSQQVTNDMGSRYLIRAKDVTLTGTTLGTEDAPIEDLIYAGEDLTLQSVQMQQAIHLPVTAPIGAGGQIHVDQEDGSPSSIITRYEDAGSAEASFAGQLMLYNAGSNVIIGGVQILDLGNGAVTISESQVTQSTGLLSEASHSHSGSYLLLEERLDSDAGELTVQAMAANAVVTIQDSGDGAVTMRTLEIQGDSVIHADALLKMTSDVIIAESAFLKLTAAGSDGIAFEESHNFDGSPLSAPGSYIQDGGVLTSGKLVGNANMDIMLENVNATVQSLLAQDLTLKDATVTADGGVGSQGISDGASTVTLDGTTTVTAATIGALGLENTTFTYVDIPADANVQITGTLIRDWYRIRYEYDEEDYTLAEGTKQVMRTEETLDAAPVTGTATTDAAEYPYIPADPTAKPGASAFLVWYYKDEDDQCVALAADADTADIPVDISNHEDGLRILTGSFLEPADNGVKTLTVYARTEISAGVEAAKGRLFESIQNGGIEVTTPADNAWTAMIQVNAYRSPDMMYQADFGAALPAGTDLTLTWLNPDAGMPKYYSYTADGSAQAIPFSSFKAMGTGESFHMTEGIDKEDTFLLAVDYTDAFANGSSKPAVETFTFQVQTLAETRGIADAGYTTTAADTSGSIRREGSTVIINVPENEKFEGKTVAVIAQWKGAGPLPYLTKAKLGDTAGTILGGDHILFPLGKPVEAQYEITGIDPAGFEWSLVLIENKSQHNTWMPLA